MMQECDVLLINPPYPRRHGGGIIPPIGLCSLAASLRNVGAVPFILDLAALFPDFDFRNADAPIEAVRLYLSNSRPDSPVLIGIGPLVTATLRSARDIVETCRREVNSTIIVGGPLCSVPGFSEVAKRYLGVDAYVAGDGETPIVSFWRMLVGNSTGTAFGPGLGWPGLSQPQPFREPKLDVLPVPARDLLSNYDYRSSSRRNVGSPRTTAAFLSRGCPYSCSFCAAPLTSGRIVRRLSKGRITEEIASCTRTGFKSIIFYDDCLFVKSHKLEKRVLEFADAVISADWHGKFQLELRCDAVVSLSDRALSALIRTGCRQINMGIEKAHNGQLQRLHKKLSPEIAYEACMKVSSSGTRTAGTFILGGPGENKDDLESTIEFAVSLPLDFAHFNPLALYPGTSIFRQVFGDSSANWLEFCLDEELAPLGDILWRSSNLPLAMILEAIESAYNRFYSPERLEWVLSRHPKAEHRSIIASYEILAHKRARSWIDKGSDRSQLGDNNHLMPD